MSLMIFQGVEKKEEMLQSGKKKHDFMTSRAGFQIRLCTALQLQGFLSSPARAAGVRGINEEVSSALVSGGFRVPAPPKCFLVLTLTLQPVSGSPGSTYRVQQG